MGRAKSEKHATHACLAPCFCMDTTLQITTIHRALRPQYTAVRFGSASFTRLFIHPQFIVSGTFLQPECMFAATSTQMYASKKQSQPKHRSASCTPPRVLDLVHNVANPMLQIATAAVEYQCPSPCITIERILITAATPKRETQKKWLSGHVHKQRGKEAKQQGTTTRQDAQTPPGCDESKWMSRREWVEVNESKRMSQREWVKEYCTCNNRAM